MSNGTSQGPCGMLEAHAPVVRPPRLGGASNRRVAAPSTATRHNPFPGYSLGFSLSPAFDRGPWWLLLPCSTSLGRSGDGATTADPTRRRRPAPWPHCIPRFDHTREIPGDGVRKRRREPQGERGRPLPAATSTGSRLYRCRAKFCSLGKLTRGQDIGFGSMWPLRASISIGSPPVGSR